jgi:hypothetical protein
VKAKVGDRVRIVDSPGGEGVVEDVTNRFELRPYTTLVALSNGRISTFTDDEYEVIQ